MKLNHRTAAALAALAFVAVLAAGCMGGDREGAAADQANDTRTGESQDRSQPSYEAPSAPAPPGGTFTFSCGGFWNGLWCGGNQGFPGSTHALYYCYHGTGQLVVNCSGLCVGGPPGVQDHC